MTNFQHGMSKTPTYKTWLKMRERCTNPNADQWKWYGGRGIKVCDAWAEFEQFFADMGIRPDDRTLDRIDGNGNYEPGNCRWADRHTQAINKSHVINVEYRGIILPLRTLCAEKNLSFMLVYQRMRAGHDLEAALTNLRHSKPKKPERKCTVDGCRRKHKGRGLCILHLNRKKAAERNLALASESTFASSACRQGLIKSTERYVKSVSPATHSHPVLLWLAVES